MWGPGMWSPRFCKQEEVSQDLVGAKGRDTWSRGSQDQVTKSKSRVAGDDRGQIIPRGPLTLGMSPQDLT